MTGVALSNSSEKTVKVLVERLDKHTKYQKYLRYRAKYLVHDSHNKCQAGDRVRIVETRPISKLKRWRVLEIIER